MSTGMTKAAFFGVDHQIERVYAMGRRVQVAELTALWPDVVTREAFDDMAAQLAEVEVVFSTWGMPPLTTAQVAKLPMLKAVFYAAGTVQGFARPFLERGVIVTSAWRANGLPVAEFTVAQILLANKGYFTNLREAATPVGRANVGPRACGNFGATVALLGAGAIGRQVIELLRPFELNVIVYDPFLPDEVAASLGVEKVSLEAAFERGHVVSNHLANKQELRGVLHGGLFERMSESATFINTGRGAQVVEDDLARVCLQRPRMTALLDVTSPEPPAPDSPLYTTPNIHLSSHIAGSIGDEVVRLADCAIAEFRRWQAGEPLQHAVTLEMLATMA